MAVELTQNYLRLYLSHIADDTMDQDVLDAIKNSTGTPARAPKGLLIHCISGTGTFRVGKSVANCFDVD
jgi:hypothetical protein